MKYIFLSSLLFNTTLIFASAAGVSEKTAVEAKPALLKKNELAQIMVTITKAQADAIAAKQGFNLWPKGEQGQSCKLPLNKIISNVAVHALIVRPQSTNKDFAPEPEINNLTLAQLKYNRYASHRIAPKTPVIVLQKDKSFIFGVVIGNTKCTTTHKLRNPDTHVEESFERSEDAYEVQTSFFEQMTVPVLSVAVQDVE